MRTYFNITVIKQFFIYSAGAFFLRAVSVLIVPFIMQKMPPAKFGTLSLITSFIAIVSAMMGLGLRQIISIEYFHCTTHKEKSSLINDIIVIYSVVALPLLLGLYCNQATVIRAIFFDTITTPTYIIILLTIFFSFFAELLYQLMQYQREAFYLTILQISIALINSSLTVLFLWYYKLEITGIVSAQLIGMIYATVVAAYAYAQYNYSLPKVKKSLLKTKYYLCYGIPFISSVLFNWIISSGDRWIIGHYHTMYEVGIYSTADLFALLFHSLIIQPWSGSYLPYIMRRYKQYEYDLPSIEQENQRNMWLVMSVGLVLILSGLFFFKPILHQILPPQYHAALNYLCPLLIGQLFLLGSYFCSSLIQFHKKKYFIAFSYAIPATLNIGLNLILVPSYAIYGAAIATLTSYMLFFIVTLLYNRHLQKRNSYVLHPEKVTA